jgi:hypothetical protein
MKNKETKKERRLNMAIWLQKNYPLFNARKYIERQKLVDELCSLEKTFNLKQ